VCVCVCSFVCARGVDNDGVRLIACGVRVNVGTRECVESRRARRRRGVWRVGETSHHSSVDDA
jgi:hypothetical protein